MTQARGSVTVFGSLNMDEVIRVGHLPSPGETVLASGLSQFAGGKGANQAVAAARAGAKVRMIGSIGDDAAGHTLLAALDAEGIDRTSVRLDAHLPTGRAYVLVDDRGENQIVVSPGANAQAKADPTDNARIYLCQLETPCEQVAAFLARRPVGSIGILNAAPFARDALSLFARCDIVVINETELAAYCSAPIAKSPNEAAELARTLLRHTGQQIVVSLGARGSVTVGNEGVSFASAESARVMDSTAAGDCFCGYLAARLARDCDFADSVAYAHRAAAIAVGRAGTMSSIPFASELRWPR